MNTNKRTTLETKLDDMVSDPKNKAMVNHEGSLLFGTSEKTSLYLAASTWMVGEPKFYETSNEETDRIIGLIHIVAENDPNFVLDLAVYLRNSMYLRMAPQVLLAETAMTNRTELTKGTMREYTQMIIQRPDEICSIIAYIKSRNKKVPMGIKRGIADKFGEFNEATLQKYNRTTRQVKLKNALTLSHPKPKNDEQSKMFKRLLEDKLTPGKTWETKISESGSSQESWSEIIVDMKYMATLRNLRNLMKYEAGIDVALERITDEKNIKNSKQFPYRFYSAWKSIESEPEDPGMNKGEIMSALSKAMNTSVGNMNKLEGKTAILADVSWSMQSAKVSGKSNVSCSDVATLYSSIASSFCKKSIVYAFSSEIKQVVPASSDIFANMESIQNSISHNGTNGYLAIKELIDSGKSVDRIIIFTDMQIWDDNTMFRQDDGQAFQTEFLRYKNSVNPNVKLYCVNLAGYPGVMMPEGYPNVYTISGFSDKMFDFVKNQDARFEAIEAEIRRSYDDAKQRRISNIVR